MKSCKIQVKPDPVDQSPRIFVAGHDISAAARGVTVYVEAGRMPKVEVQLSTRDTQVDLPEAVVEVVSWRSPLEGRYRELLDRALVVLEGGEDKKLLWDLKAATEQADKIGRGEI